MKFKYLASGLVLSVALLTSCKKAELFQDPMNSISASDAFSTPDRIEKAAVGMYDALQNANYLGGRVLIYSDQRGLDETPNTFFGQMGFYTTLNSSDGTVAGAWQGAYRTIYQANLFLQGFTANASSVSQAKADQYVGEAKFIRAITYFYLVNLYAQPYNFTADASHPGVPLVLAPAADPFDASNQLPRASVKAVYAQIETDLLEAASKLPQPTDAFTRTARASKQAANAFLSRVYLYEGNWAKAVQYADLVINSGIYALQANPATPFRTFTTNESIFSVAMSGSDNPNTNNSLGQHYNPRARGDISVTTDYINLMDTTVDLRFKNLVEKYNGAFWTTKYAGLTTDYVPVIRYAEVLLIKAEGLARQATGVDATALSLLNQVRTRSNAAAYTTANITTQQQLIDAILKERRIELAFEGQGMFEFQRNKLDLPAHSTVPAVPFGSNYRVLPIPKYDTDKNPNLVQNPGY